MRKFIKVLLLLILMLFISNINVKSFQPLYEIELYETIIKTRKNGTLDVRINMESVVLDSTTNGPLNIIEIKVHNKYVDEIIPISNNIDDIKYKTKMFKGTFIEIYLDRSYETSEKISISFSYHQSKMYNLYNEYCDYDYYPITYEGILIKKAIVKWDKEKVMYSNANKEDESYFIWEKSLNNSGNMRIIIRYSQNSFIGLNSKMEYTDSSFKINKLLLLFLGVALVVVVTIGCIFLFRRMIDPYKDNRGFSTYCGELNSPRYKRRGTQIRGLGNVGRNPRYPAGGASAGHVSHSKGFSCACACAGGGMGRAGCSKKDFYKTNLFIKRL